MLSWRELRLKTFNDISQYANRLRRDETCNNFCVFNNWTSLTAWLWKTLNQNWSENLRKRNTSASQVIKLDVRYTRRPICDRLWQKQAFGLKISFVHFSLELINNNFWLKCCKNYYSIFIGSRDMNFIMLFSSEVQFREKRLQSVLI